MHRRVRHADLATPGLNRLSPALVLEYPSLSLRLLERCLRRLGAGGWGLTRSSEAPRRDGLHHDLSHACRAQIHPLADLFIGAAICNRIEDLSLAGGKL